MLQRQAAPPSGACICLFARRGSMAKENQFKLSITSNDSDRRHEAVLHVVRCESVRW
jgi:hypothetical protein